MPRGDRGRARRGVVAGIDISPATPTVAAASLLEANGVGGGPRWRRRATALADVDGTLRRGARQPARADAPGPGSDDLKGRASRRSRRRWRSARLLARISYEHVKCRAGAAARQVGAAPERGLDCDHAAPLTPTDLGGGGRHAASQKGSGRAAQQALEVGSYRDRRRRAQRGDGPRATAARQPKRERAGSGARALGEAGGEPARRRIAGRGRVRISASTGMAGSCSVASSLTRTAPSDPAASRWPRHQPCARGAAPAAAASAGVDTAISVHRRRLVPRSRPGSRIARISAGRQLAPAAWR